MSLNAPFGRAVDSDSSRSEHPKQQSSLLSKTLICLMALSTLSLNACLSHLFLEVPQDHQQAFLFGVEQSQSERYELSTRAAWRYLSNTNEEDPRYDRALRLLARGAEKLGLSYAASAWYLQIASAQRDVTLIPEAVEGIQRIVERGVFDEDALINRYIAVEELSTMGASIDSFVHYYQGLHDLRQGEDRWAKRRFRQIHPESEYIDQARYVIAVQKVAMNQLSDAEARFEKIARRLAPDLESANAVGSVSSSKPSTASDDRPRKVHLEQSPLSKQLWRDAMTSLARLAMQKGDATTALRYFEVVRERVPDDPSLLLEIAWAHFQKGSPRRALGFLLALDAPIYNALIAPERFILEAMTYRSLCQFGPARQAAVRLSDRYREALNDLYNGVLPERSDALRKAASQRGDLLSISQFIASLDREVELIKSRAGLFGSKFTEALLSLYAQGKASAMARRERTLRVEIKRLTDELLSAEEGVRLITHELGVALLRGRKPPKGRGPVPPVGEIAESSQVVYSFNGEFWTDELDELIVAAEDRCIDQ